MRRVSRLILGLLFFGGGFSLQATQYRFKPPVNLGPPVNTTWSEEDPYVTADGQKLFFCSNRPGGLGGYDIWISTWNGTSWSEPVNPGPNVNSPLDDWSPTLSPDGKKLYFMVFGRPGGVGGWDIWVSTYDSALQQWGPPQNLGSPINTTAVDWSPEISYDGQSLYYMSNGKGHPRGQALYVSQWNGTSWGTPEALPLNINYTATEERPSLTAEENTMYFVRWLVSTGGHPAIHVTEKISAGVWSEPVILDSLINTPGGNSGPCITPDGKKLFFGSVRAGGVGGPGTADIWVAERIIEGRVPSLNWYLLPILSSLLLIVALFWIKREKLKPT